MINIVVKKYVKEENRTEFLKAVQPLVDGSKNESGNISYNISLDPNDPNVIYFIENWESAEYVRNIHCATDHVVNVVPTLEKFYFAEGTEVWLDPVI